jgi:hypothetical protein
MSTFIKGVSLHGVKIMGSTVPLSPNIIFWAPLNTSTESTDITANPVAAVVNTPYPRTITYGDSAIFYSRYSDGNDTNTPSLVYSSSKFDPALYPTQTITLSAKINITGYTLGGSYGCSILKYGYNSSYVQLVAYAEGGSLRIITLYGDGTYINDQFNGDWPAGENTFTIEWTPAGIVSWYMNGTLLRSIQGGTRYNAPLQIGGSSYNQYTTYGVYEISIRDVVYQVGPPMS